MRHVSAIMLAAAILFVGPVVSTMGTAGTELRYPALLGTSEGGQSTHYKTVDDGLWPWENDGKGRASTGQAMTTGRAENGYWI